MADLPLSIQYLGQNRYQLPHHHMPSKEATFASEGKQYFFDQIPGITSEDVRGASELYHKIGEDEVPHLMIERRTMFRVEQFSDDVDDKNIVELVTDLGTAKKVLDAIVQERGNVWNPKTPSFLP